MPQHYSDQSREADPHALPDIEVFWYDGKEKQWEWQTPPFASGWYWWRCFPGCLPDSDPNGPYDSEAEALAGARNVSA